MFHIASLWVDSLGCFDSWQNLILLFNVSICARWDQSLYQSLLTQYHSRLFMMVYLRGSSIVPNNPLQCCKRIDFRPPGLSLGLHLEGLDVHLIREVRLD